MCYYGAIFDKQAFLEVYQEYPYLWDKSFLDLKVRQVLRDTFVQALCHIIRKKSGDAAACSVLINLLYCRRKRDLAEEQLIKMFSITSREVLKNEIRNIRCTYNQEKLIKSKNQENWKRQRDHVQSKVAMV